MDPTTPPASSRQHGEITSPVLIKSSAGERDLTVDVATPSWTVKQLKMHLMLNHPSKPQIHEQKLVHGGKLLDDSLRLEDVFNSYDEDDKRCMHLVVAGQALKRSLNDFGSEGLRNRKNTGASLMSNTMPSADDAPTAHDWTPQAAAAAAAAAAAPTPPVSWYHHQSPSAPSPSIASPTIASPVVPSNTASPLQYQYYQHQQAAWYAMYYSQYAQQLAAAGYPQQYVDSYNLQARYFQSMAGQMQAASPMHMPNAVASSGVPLMSPPPVEASLNAGMSENAQNTPTSGATVAEANNAVEPPAGRFAQAGQGAEPGFVDRNEPQPEPRNQGGERRRVFLEQIGLILKLAFFMAYFGAHISGWRYAALVVLCILTFLYQGGWIQRQNGPQAQAAANNDVGDAPIPNNVGDDAENDQANAEEDGGADVSAQRGQRGEGVDAVDDGSDRETNDNEHDDVGSEVQEEVNDATLDNNIELAPHVPALSLPQLVGNIFLKFFTSMVPGGVARPNAQ